MPASCTQSRICMQGSSCSVVSGTKHLQSEVSMPGNLIHLVAKCLLASSEGGGNCTGRSFKKMLILALLLPSQQMRAFRAVLDPQDDLFLCTAGNPLTSCTSKGLGMTTAAKREESYKKGEAGSTLQQPEGSLSMKCALCHCVKVISPRDGCLLTCRYYCCGGDSLL